MPLPKIARLSLLAVLTALTCAATAGRPADARADFVDRLLAPKSACPGQKRTGLSLRRQTKIMVCMHRYARKRAGRARLRTVRALRWSARRKANDILACQEFSHSACGREPMHWPTAVGFLRSCNGASENIILGSGRKGSARRTMRGWLESDSHRRVLLRSRYRLGGIGLAKGTYRGYAGAQVWVAHFGYRC